MLEKVGTIEKMKKFLVLAYCLTLFSVGQSWASKTISTDSTMFNITSFTSVDEETLPSFNGGGVDAFRSWIKDTFRYLQSAVERDIQGRVIIQFTVDTAGYVINVEVLRGIDSIVDAEVVRVVESSPRWKPGKRPKSNLYTLPILFPLEQGKSKIKQKKNRGKK